MTTAPAWVRSPATGLKPSGQHAEENVRTAYSVCLDKWHPRREAGSQSQGSLADRPAAERNNNPVTSIAATPMGHGLP